MYYFLWGTGDDLQRYKLAPIQCPMQVVHMESSHGGAGHLGVPPPRHTAASPGLGPSDAAALCLHGQFAGLRALGLPSSSTGLQTKAHQALKQHTEA